MNAKFISALVLIAVAISGCATPKPLKVVECTVPKDERPRPAGPALVGPAYGMEMTPIPLDAVQFTNQALAETMIVQTVSARRTELDTVKVTARLVNCTDNQVNMQMRTSFMDASQVSTEPISAWHTVIVQPRATAVYQENSIGRGAVAHYLIEVAPY